MQKYTFYEILYTYLTQLKFAHWFSSSQYKEPTWPLQDSQKLTDQCYRSKIIPDLKHRQNCFLRSLTKKTHVSLSFLVDSTVIEFCQNVMYFQRLKKIIEQN